MIHSQKTSSEADAIKINCESHLHVYAFWHAGKPLLFLTNISYTVKHRGVSMIMWDYYVAFWVHSTRKNLHYEILRGNIIKERNRGSIDERLDTVHT